MSFQMDAARIFLDELMHSERLWRSMAVRRRSQHAASGILLNSCQISIPAILDSGVMPINKTVFDQPAERS